MRELLAISPFDTLWQALGSHFKDPRLRQLFARYATYCGSSPFMAPATLMLVAHAEREGVFYVEGGMRRLADALVKLAAGAARASCLAAMSSGSSSKAAPRRGVLAAERRIFRGRRDGFQWRCVGARQRLGAEAGRAAPPTPAGRAFALGAHFRRRRRGERLSPGPSHGVVWSRLSRGNSTPSSNSGACRRSRPSMSARATATDQRDRERA